MQWLPKSKLILILSVFVFQSCRFPIGKKPISQGIMKYNITYLEDENQNPIISLMPSFLDMKFKNNSVAMEVEGWMGVFKTSFIKVGKSDESITLLKMLNKKYCYRSDSSDGFLGFNDYHDPVIEFDDSVKEILNYTCKHAKVTIPDRNLTFNVFYTMDINIEHPNDYTPFAKIPGVLMEFQIEINKIPMYLIASEIIESDIPDEVFEIPSDYEIVPKEELEKIFASLI